MNRRTIALGIAILVVISGVIGLISFEAYSVQAPTNTLYVSHTGPGHYHSIQSAIDNASEGDTIRVYAGFYNENITINKSINFIGNGSANTILSHNETIIHLGGHFPGTDWCNISGFTLKDSQYAGISISNSDYSCISDVVCINNSIGIGLSFALYFSITNCQIINNAKGIRMDHSHAGTINYCLFENNTGYAMDLYGGFSSNSRNQIYNNTFLFNNGSNSTYNSSKIQVLDTTQLWDSYWNNSDGYGNYWSDWTSPDIDSNGIVDNPYEINSYYGWKDHYPLVNPPTPISYSPKILVKNDPIAFANQKYSINYSAFDPDTPQEQLIWTYNSNASWLSFSSAQELCGMPDYSDIGGYWVDISVTDGMNSASTNFTINVKKIDSKEDPNGNVIILRTNQRFIKIQDAINASKIGDTIFVYNGTYNENIIIDKSIKLVGENKNSTIIYGNKMDSVIYINANDVNITGFTIRNGRWGIWLYNSTNNILENINASNNDNGIYLLISDNNLIIDCNINNNTEEWGLYLSGSSNNIILNCQIKTNYLFGIYLLSSYFNDIENCSISNNRHGIYIDGSDKNTITNCELIENYNGIILFLSSKNLITDCNIFKNDYAGIGIYGSPNNTLNHCSISSNNMGVSIHYFDWSIIDYYGMDEIQSDNNKIYNCIISNNNDIGIKLESSWNYNIIDNRIFNNNFINNEDQAYDNTSTNFWNDTYPYCGNYWDDYSGLDEYKGINQDQPGSDGIGDFPYTKFTGNGGATDHYPFVDMIKIENLSTLPSFPYYSYTKTGNGYINITWYPPRYDGNSPVLNYKIYKDRTWGTELFYTKIGNQLFYNDTNVTNGVTYFYKISAVNAIGEGPLSFEIYATPKGSIIPFTGTILYVGGLGPGNYTRIQDAIDNASIGNTVFVYNGLYNESVYIGKQLNLIGEDKNNTIIEGKDFSAIYSETDNIQISGFTITNGVYGVNLCDSSNNNISDNKIISNQASGISLFNTSNNNIINNYFSLNGDSGLKIEQSSNCNVIDNKFENEGIYLWGDKLEYYNSFIFNNNFVNNKPMHYYKNINFFSLESVPVGQIILANCSNFNLKNLQINDTNIGINIAYSQNITITNTNLINNEYGIFFKSSSNNTLENNNLSSNEVGIYFNKLSNDNIFQNNNFINNLRAIGVSGIENNHFISNNFSYNFEGIMMFHFSKNNNIIDNIFLYCGESLTIYQSSNNVITGNRFLNNIVGPVLSESLNSNISNNEILNNDRGIRIFWKSSNNIISNNNISNNRLLGIGINSSFDNRIYHNNFINNGNQSFDDSDDNFWDNGYPSGGNYWSDYNGTDADGDGIGDTPYIIDEDSQDNYPLMETWDIEIEELMNIEIILDLDKTEFYLNETISGSVHITNNNPFDITLNDLPWQIMVGIFFNITNLDDNTYHYAVYNRYPIEVATQSTISIDFELYEMNTLSPDASGSVLLNLPVGNYSIYSYFYYGTSVDYEVIFTNTVNFRIIGETSPPPGGNGGTGSGTDDLSTTLIFVSATGLVLLIIILTLFVTATELGKYKFASMFIAPLYARELRKRKRKDVFVRGKILGYVIGNPGDNYNTIKHKLKLTNGALAYHLQILERKHEIRAERDGVYKRFYPFEGRITEEVFELSKLQKRVYNLIEERPGITQTEISKELGESVQRINYHIQMMVDARIIKLVRKGKHTKCYILENVN